MSINCHIIVRSGATAEELITLGTALWRWYSRSCGDAVLCQSLDNQGLADLLAGRLPTLCWTPRFAGRRFVHLRVPGWAYRDRAATLASLRGELPPGRFEEFVIDGERWTPGAPPSVPIEIGVRP